MFYLEQESGFARESKRAVKGERGRVSEKTTLWEYEKQPGG